MCERQHSLGGAKESVRRPNAALLEGPAVARLTDQGSSRTRALMSPGTRSVSDEIIDAEFVEVPPSTAKVEARAIQAPGAPAAKALPLLPDVFAAETARLVSRSLKEQIDDIKVPEDAYPETNLLLEDPGVKALRAKRDEFEAEFQVSNSRTIYELERGVKIVGSVFARRGAEVAQALGRAEVIYTRAMTEQNKPALGTPTAQAATHGASTPTANSQQDLAKARAAKQALEQDKSVSSALKNAEVQRANASRSGKKIFMQWRVQTFLSDMCNELGIEGYSSRRMEQDAYRIQIVADIRARLQKMDTAYLVKFNELLQEPRF